MSHANAALTPRARLRVARLVIDQGVPIVEVAARFQCSWPTVKRWSDRYAAGLPMTDRSSRPHSMPAKTCPTVTKRIVALRLRKRLGPVQLAALTGVAPSTAHRVLVRCRLNRLSHVDRATGEPVRRYEHPYPGALLHVDVKKLGNIPDGGGWRFVGRVQGSRNRAGTDPIRRKGKNRGPLVGHAFIHTVIDDHSRVGYAEVHDETAATATAVLRRAVAWFAARGVTTERVLSDNGSPYVSHLWRDTCAELGIRHTRTRPPTATDQREDRTLPPHPGRRVGLRPRLQLRKRTPCRPASMDPRVQPPPAPHRLRQQATHHPLNQPVGSVQLVSQREVKRLRDFGWSLLQFASVRHLDAVDLLACREVSHFKGEDAVIAAHGLLRVDDLLASAQSAEADCLPGFIPHDNLSTEGDVVIAALRLARLALL